MRIATALASAAILLSAACEYIPSDVVDPSFGVVAVTVQPKGVTLLVGDSAQLGATVLMSNNRPPRSASWTSASPSVASVSGTGMVFGLVAGSTFILATSGSKRDSSAVTVVGPPPVSVASVTVTPASATIAVGSGLTLVATPKDSAGNPLSGRSVTWATSAGPVATVSTSGQVMGMAAGAATITATSGGRSGTATVTVSPVPVASVTVSPSTAAIYVGGAVQLSATPKDSTGNALAGRLVTWSTSALTVAGVSTNGKVTGLVAGSATLTATSEGKSGTATVTVSLVPVTSVTVTPSTASVPVGGTVPLAATPKDSGGNLLSGRTITWTTTAASVATVTASGLVTGVVAGTATITATSEGKNGTSAVTVVTQPPPSSCTPGYGTFGVGVWPPACYRPYDTTAWINRPLPANPQLDPNSAAIVAALNSHGLPMDKGAGVVGDYDHPIYWSKASDPVYRLASCGYSGALTGFSFHALKGMLVGGGSDAHLVVMDQSTNTEWDFWQAVVDDNAQSISAHACGKLPISGDGRIINGTGSGDGGNAANTGLYTGQLRAVELVAGAIQHPIAITVTCTNGGWVYPASGSALACGSAHEPADGQLFQLTYSDAEIDALAVPAWKKGVLHAMHQYGFYVDDTGAGSSSNPVSMQLHFESDKMFQAFGYEDPFVTYAKAHLGQDIYQSGGAYYYQLAPGVDWSRIQVIGPCVIQRTC